MLLQELGVSERSVPLETLRLLLLLLLLERGTERHLALERSLMDVVGGSTVVNVDVDDRIASLGRDRSASLRPMHTESDSSLATALDARLGAFRRYGSRLEVLSMRRWLALSDRFSHFVRSTTLALQARLSVLALAIRGSSMGSFRDRTSGIESLSTIAN